MEKKKDKEKTRIVKIKMLFDSENDKIRDWFHFLFPYVDRKKFKIVESSNPDFVFFMRAGNSSDWLNYNCIRISVDSERYTPDFNTCDYAITDDILNFGDRFFCMPYLAYGSMRNSWKELKGKEKQVLSQEDLKKKKRFCNFIYSNKRAHPMRRELFYAVSQYKKVDSGGELLNNIGYRIAGGIGDYEAKIKFQSEYKFTLAIENVKSPGHTTEKLLHAFLARTIPIYWGNEQVSEFFNPQAMIQCKDFDSLKEIVARIQELDENEDQYLKMINQPLVNPDFNPETIEKEMCKFIEHIIEQDPEKAVRRTKILHSQFHEQAYRKGRRSWERKRKLYIKGAKIMKKSGIHNTFLTQWIRKKFY